MGLIYENLLRPWLFTINPELAHNQTIDWLKQLQDSPMMLRLLEAYSTHASGKPVECFGLQFPNPVGLAAGFDKNAEVWPAMAALGFGHIEVGTVTLMPQEGNPKPRIFRYPEHKALINRMGFPGEGAEAVAARIKDLRSRFGVKVPIGINIGKNRAVDTADAAENYAAVYRIMAPLADYIAVNVSSPNTPDLRSLQARHALDELLAALRTAEAGLSRSVPMLVKLSPDLSFRQIDDVLSVCQARGVKGIIAGNTTTTRPVDLGTKDQTGGFSGYPLNARAVQVVKYIYKATSGKMPIIGVGGVVDNVTAGALMDAGASLIQVYTGMVYKGPFFARTLARGLSWSQRSWI